MGEFRGFYSAAGDPRRDKNPAGIMVACLAGIKRPPSKLASSLARRPGR